MNNTIVWVNSIAICIYDHQLQIDVMYEVIVSNRDEFKY